MLNSIVGMQAARSRTWELQTKQRGCLKREKRKENEETARGTFKLEKPLEHISQK